MQANGGLKKWDETRRPQTSEDGSRVTTGLASAARRSSFQNRLRPWGARVAGAPERAQRGSRVARPAGPSGVAHDGSAADVTAHGLAGFPGGSDQKIRIILVRR